MVALQCLRSAQDRLFEARVIFFKLRDQRVPQPVAEVGLIGVGSIDMRFQVVGLAVGYGIGAPQAQQWADERNLRVEDRQEAAIFHALETRQTGAAQKMHQDGFDLIIGGMTDRHRLGGVLLRGGEQKTVAQIAGSFFDRERMFPGMQLNIRRVAHKRQAQTRGDSRNGRGFLGGLRAQLVVEMGDDQRVAGGVQDPEQAQAVGPARDTHQHRPVWIQSALLLQDRFQHQACSSIT